MHATTKTAHFNVPTATLFGFLSQVENLPKWATTFCQGLKRSGNDYMVETPKGEMFFAIEANERTGIIDMRSGPTKQDTWCWPARVASDNLTGSLLIFTAVQMPDQDDASFAQECRALESEFENIRRLVEA